jgi:hypothetical protein
VFTSERGAPFSTAGFARMVERAGTPDWLDGLAFMKLLIAIIDIFQEATELRRAAYRKCPSNDE